MTSIILDAKKLAAEFRVSETLMSAFLDKFAPSRVVSDQHKASSEVMLFIHIPKTAGVSVGRSLREAFDRFHSVAWDNIPQSFRTVARSAVYQQTCRDERQVIMGHFGWPEMQMFRNHEMPMKCGTILRHPVARTISNYNYNCSSAHPANEQFRKRYPSLEAYVDDLPSDVQVTQALGFINSFENALEKLVRYYSFLGVTEHLSASLAHLGRSHGLQKLREYRENVGVKRGDKKISSEIVKKIEARSHNDKRLHDLIMRLYQS
ncbi:sulfotransferase family 2 domain-containing protein [Paracoccus pantotrophus]|uniref:sulfotransferase family 2 domain-containing protein n=1 Tax=Paracoccus pantotrophus TaxID=82367 RepID=UPI0009DDD73D|nr:sulfotransferase family 2 domain-containing protein [Paracoccus pantotrophus]